ncbi:MAG TPA: M20/M25/M40 family metallo-hydrolase, partial [Armatimonadota bacterium]|nr:M20/M25/M40 family metallo-hydrolase [Armatimonadota bacterium]
IDDFGNGRLAARPDCRTNIGILDCGVHPAVVPGKARMSLNMVYHYDEALSAEQAGHSFGAGPIREGFEAAIAGADAGDEWLSGHPSRVEWVKDLVPFSVPEDAPAIQRLATMHGEMIGTTPEFNHMVGWSDACYYAHHAGTPTVLFGPGKSGFAHSPDEHVEIDSLVNVCKVLACFLAEEMGG